MPRPKNAEREDVRVLVLEKAKALFLSIGYHKITMRRIAEEIGYTPGTIYLYFSNKEEILYELHNQGFELLYQYKLKTASAAHSSAFDRLWEGGKTYLAFALDHPDYYELMFNMPEPHHFLSRLREAESGERRTMHIDYAMRSYEFLKQTIQDCISEGSLPKTDPDVMTFAFWSFVHGVVSLTIRKRIPYPQAASQAFAESAIDFFMHAIGQPPSHIDQKES